MKEEGRGFYLGRFMKNGTRMKGYLMEPGAFKRQWREDATEMTSYDGLNTPEKKRLVNDYFEPKTTLGTKALVSKIVDGVNTPSIVRG